MIDLEHKNFEILPKFDYSLDNISNLVPLNDKKVLAYSKESKYFSYFLKLSIYIHVLNKLKDLWCMGIRHW